MLGWVIVTMLAWVVVALVVIADKMPDKDALTAPIPPGGTKGRTSVEPAVLRGEQRPGS